MSSLLFKEFRYSVITCWVLSGKCAVVCSSSWKHTVYCNSWSLQYFSWHIATSPGVNIIWFIRQWMLLLFFRLEKHVGPAVTPQRVWGTVNKTHFQMNYFYTDHSSLIGLHIKLLPSSWHIPTAKEAESSPVDLFRGGLKAWNCFIWLFFDRIIWEN